MRWSRRTAIGAAAGLGLTALAGALLNATGSLVGVATDVTSRAPKPALKRVLIGPRRYGEHDDTAAIQRAIDVAAAHGGGTVESRSANSTYEVGVAGRTVALNPSGGRTIIPYCLVLHSGVTLSMRGSTVQLQGETPATMIVNTAAHGNSRDRDIGLVDVTLDGRGLVTSRATMMRLAYIDGLKLQSVKIVNGMYQGAWIYDVSNGVFDDLDCDSFIGQPWTIGSPLPTGNGRNAVYDSKFGHLRAENVRLLNREEQPGNPYNFVLTRCSIASILVRNCDSGIKLQQPSSDVHIGTVRLENCGERSVLNSGMKIQGDPQYPAGKDRPTRVHVAEIFARNQANMGLYMFHAKDCSVSAYTGVGNVTLHPASSDVLISDGINDRVSFISSKTSGGGGVRVTGTSASSGSHKFSLNQVVVTNPGQNDFSRIKSGVRIEHGSSGSLGSVDCIDNQREHTMDYGIRVFAGVSGELRSSMCSGALRAEIWNSSSAFHIRG